MEDYTVFIKQKIQSYQEFAPDWHVNSMQSQSKSQ